MESLEKEGGPISLSTDLYINYPSRSKSDLTIGITAPSSGLGQDAFIKRYELVVQQHEERGISIFEGKCLRENSFHVSATRAERVKDFLEQWNNPAIDLIQPPWGGELLIEILELIDFEALKKSPKWVQGYSDISTLLFAITLNTGIATAHGTNFIDSIDGQDRLTKNSRDYLNIAAGEVFIQKSSARWQKNFTDFAKKLDAAFNHTEETHWKLLAGDSTEFSGRMIGGCIDTIMHLVGTKYGDLATFFDQYAKEEGLILYLENCEQSPADLYRALMGMKYAGWFHNINGLIFGRNSGADNEGFSYLECLKQVFGGVDYPVVWDADIGHKPPQMTIINGSLGTLRLSGGKADLTQRFC